MIPITAVLIAVFLCVSIFSGFSVKNAADLIMTAQISDALDIAAQQLRLSESVVNITVGALDGNSLARARALAYIIAEDETSLAPHRMQQIAEVLGVDEVYVTDENGILAWGNVPENVGYDFSSAAQSRPFLRILEEPEYELAQEPSPRGVDGKMFQYAGVARIGKPGIVQVGTAADSLSGVRDSLSVQNAINRLKIGTDGGIFVLNTESVVIADSKRNRIGSDLSDEAWTLAPLQDGGRQQVEFFYDGVAARGECLIYRNYRIVAYIPIVEQNSYIISPVTTSLVVGLVGSLALTLLLFILIRRIVIDPLERIGQDTAALTAGGHMEKERYSGIHEFSVLCDSLNAMLERLVSSDESIRSLRETEELLQTRLRQQELMSTMSQNFVSEADVDELIDNALRLTGEFLGVSRVVATVMAHDKVDDARTDVRMRYWAKYPDFKPTEARRDVGAIIADGFPARLNHGMRVPTLRCTDVTTSKWSDVFVDIGSRAYLWAPMYENNEYRGMISIEECEQPREWTDSDAQLASLISNIIVSADARSRSQHDLMRQDKLLHTVNEIASILLRSDIAGFEDNLHKCMGMMAESVSLDRVYIWRHEMIEGKPHCRWAHSWLSYDELYLSADAVDNAPYEVPDWYEKLIQGETISGPASEARPVTREILTKLGIRSVLIVPLFLQNVYQGFVSFDDCSRERGFSEDELAILRSGSLLMASSLVRNEMVQSLIQAREEAFSATRAKSDFLSNMSHEMRTPMNAIIGMTAIAKATDDVRSKDEALNKIDSASGHLLGVINDILDMSKIEANKFELSSVPFVFQNMLQKVVNVVNFRVEEKHQHFNVRFDPAIPRTLIGDDQRFAQVIANLLSNAVKFTPEHGSIDLIAELEQLDDASCALKVSVKDTGIGISQEQIAKLFNSFQQAESSISRKFGGTGLGLAISKRIVEMMDGTIWVESEVGKGSTFIFTAILGRTEGEEVRIPLSANVDWDSVRILAADADPDVRTFFIECAKVLNLQCDVAENGEDALALMRNGAYDICFYDWNMPATNGIAFAEAARESANCKAIVALISATEWSVIEREARAAGVDRYMSKPLFPSPVIEFLDECLGGETAETSDPAAIDDFSGYTLLLAEDVDINREIVCTLLAPTKLTIDCAENGRRALELFSANPERYNMIFMDVQMPEMDGHEATRRIRALPIPRAKTVPIVAMTANVFREDIENCLAAGMNDHLGKPLDFNDVLAMLRKQMGEKRA
jgi:signal transduction histidine kinase/DNA-binding response OmpR family regulator